MSKEKIDAYVLRFPEWQQKICKRLRELVHRADPKITEDWKWGAPAFSHDGLVCYFWCFKSWVNFTFYQGALIDDKYKILTYGCENERNRYVKFTDVKEIDDDIIISYLKETIKNNTEGNKIKNPKPKYEEVIIPEYFMKELKKHKLEKRYNELPYYQRKGWVQWIGMAKQQETKKSRMEKAVSRIKDGKYM